VNKIILYLLHWLPRHLCNLSLIHAIILSVHFLDLFFYLQIRSYCILDTIVCFSYSLVLIFGQSLFPSLSRLIIPTYVHNLFSDTRPIFAFPFVGLNLIATIQSLLILPIEFPSLSIYLFLSFTDIRSFSLCISKFYL
jgi:hypothetical protein